MTNTETGKITGTLDKDCENDNELAELFRKAQADSKKGAEQGKKLLASRLH